MRAIITFNESLSVFEGVDTAACITLMEGQRVERPMADQVMHIQINKWPDVETILRIYRERLAELFDLLCQANSESTEKALRQTIDEMIVSMY